MDHFPDFLFAKLVHLEYKQYHGLLLEQSECVPGLNQLNFALNKLQGVLVFFHFELMQQNSMFDIYLHLQNLLMNNSRTSCR